MKVALAYSTKDRVELTEQSIMRVASDKCDIFWNDGSTTDRARMLHRLDSTNFGVAPKQKTRVTGGADAAIVFALTQMLADPGYTHVGLLENDVLLPHDWFDRTMGLFESGAKDGLDVGAVTARVYEDRILIQRPDYALLHNAGAGHVIFTRKAAQLVLEFYRSGWWSDNRAVFSQLSGLDIGEWAAFRTVDTPLTADWHFDTVLAAHGLATLGLTPSTVEMIGQNPSLEEQGLTLAGEPLEGLENADAFELFVYRTKKIRAGKMSIALRPWMVQKSPGGQQACTYFPHQFQNLNALLDGWEMRWSQGYGPFSYVAGDEATCVIPVYGPSCFVMSGGRDGARVRVTDKRSGFEVTPELPPETDATNVVAIQVPGGAHYRDIRIEASPGARLFSMQTNDEQPWHTDDTFDYSRLPKVHE